MTEFIVTYGYQNYTVTVDDEDYERVSKYNWYILHDGNTFYVQGRLPRSPKRVTLHRYILNLKPGDGIKVDHKDRNGLNNSKSNLRYATHALNNANKPKQANTTSTYKGVSFDNEQNKWRAQIMQNKKTIHLGRFTDEVDAARAYDKAALEVFGEFALVNGV